MAKTKELTIKINGADNVDKLSDSLDKVDVKTQKISLSAQEVADSYKKNFQQVMEFIVLQMAKIGAIITELNTHVEQAIQKNVEVGEKSVQNIEKTSDTILASITEKAVSASAIMEEWLKKITNQSEEQDVVLSERLAKNKELIESLEKAEKEYARKNRDLGILNIKERKENVETRIEELTRLKTEFENTLMQTRLQYDKMSIVYDKDSEEFKKVQEEKAAELEKLQEKIKEVNKGLVESNSSYKAVWETQHAEIEKKMTSLYKTGDQEDGGKIKEYIDKYTYGFKDFSDKLDKGIKEVNAEYDKTAKAEKKLNESKYNKKIENLDKELEKVNAEVTRNKKEKEQLEKDQDAATQKAEKYKKDIATIKESFEIKETDKDAETDNSDTDTTTADVALKNNSLSLPDETSPDAPLSEGEQEEDKNKITPPSDEEMEAAQTRIAELEKLAAEEEQIAADKKEHIETVDKAITESNRSALLEQMRIADEKTKLEEEKAQKEKEIEEKAQKQKDRLAKIEKVRAKAQAVYDMAVSTKDIAKGVAIAWGKGPILGPPLAALVAVQGAIQLKVMAEQLKYLEDGGLLKGRRHSQGGMRIEGTNIEVEGGEYVINRESTDKNLALVRYINSHRKELTAKDMDSFFSKASTGYEPPFRTMFASGGQMPAISNPNSIDNEALVDAIQSIKITPKVAVTDIIRVQDEMAEVQGWSGI